MDHLRKATESQSLPRDLHPGNFGEAPLTQDLLARGTAYRPRGGTTSRKFWTTPCHVEGLRAHVPFRTHQPERDALHDFDCWRPLTVHDRELPR